MRFIRGVKGAYKDVMKTVTLLDKLKRITNLHYRFSFTITPWNYKELPKVVKFAKKKETYVGYRIAHINDLYRNKNTSMNFEKEEISWIKNWIRKNSDNFFKEKIVKWCEGERAVECYAFVNSVFIDPEGFSHPCIYRRRVKGGKLSVFWNEKLGRNIRKITKRCKGCWSDCQSIPDIIAKLGRI
jgi:MoaA/NifB/PqqE/SkfB family radical SAM enzyme